VNCRLLYIVGQLGSGGLERQLCYILENIDRERYRPELVVWNFRGDDTYVPHIRKLGIPLHQIPCGMRRTAKLIAFRRMLPGIRPELIHSYTFHTNFAAWWGALGTNIIPIGSTQSDFAREKKQSGMLLGRLSARWPRQQICNSSLAANLASRCRSPFAPGRFWVVRNGVDLGTFRPAPLPATNEARIIAVGSLLAVKRWDRLLSAAAILKKRHLDFFIQIAGDGPLRAALECQARQLGVADRVQFLGHSDNIPALLANATFLVHTSETEGCPNVIIEAMACGRAIVATDAGDIPSLIENERSGFVVRRGDDEALANRMERLISDPDLCRLMGQMSRARAEREFSLDRLISDTLAAYRAAGWRESP
jgi:glycosyltransferase involved in cell wall biosynthesis